MRMYFDAKSTLCLCTARPAAATVPAAADEEDEEEEEADGNTERKVIAKKVRAKLQRRTKFPKSRNSNKQREKRKNQEMANEYLAP